MGGERAEPQMVQCKAQFPLQVSGQFLVLFASWGGRVRQGRGFLQKVTQVEDNGFEIVGGLFELAGPLQQAGLVVEHSRDD